VEIQETGAAGTPPLCAGELDLGTVSVVAETSWRADQKEPRVREAMAERAIVRAFAALPCGRVVAITPIAAAPQRAAAVDADTLVRVRIEELGPQVILSLPVLWRVNSDVRLQLSATATVSGETLLDLDHRRTVGGPFTLRPAAWAEDELEAALRDLLYER
jgi:hypothetical protein